MDALVFHSARMGSGVNRDARSLLAEATALLEQHPRLLRAAGAVVSFTGGARWMRLVLMTLRHASVRRVQTGYEMLGIGKYALSGGAAMIWTIFCIVAGIAPLIPFAAIVFYLVESRFVFVFPRRIDEIEVSRKALLRAAGNPMHVLCTIMRLALHMMLGGLRGRGIVRAWCEGCAAVVIWYEHARLASQNDRR